MSQYITTPAVPNRTLTAKLLTDALTLQEAAATVVELATTSGIYTVTFTSGTLDGTYRLLMTDSATGLGVASWQATFTGTDEETVQAQEYTSSASGAATEAKQDTIIAAITPIATVYTAQLTASTIALIRGDAYDGVSNAKLSWTPTKNIDAATGFNFTIRNAKDVVVLD